ncbi:hypothetical protein IMZ08_14350 [Bacillus luteolus]|uniref:Uncharacterized protein n=1 Tax=Litchfieldia luteola TaxID=682179 RepID=A0ABR9QL68_9BACI|nr:hypothetical protein [Cytobacillus luteolus]MBE4909244.1 hypothetical protein [Cytobacillus luteolus]MBP1940299.1 putative membrane protein [Cytobacillus luteolus]
MQLLKFELYKIAIQKSIYIAYVLLMGVHVLGALCYSLVIVLISSISKNAMIAFVPNLLMVQPFFVEATIVTIFGVNLLSPVFACFLMVVLVGIFIVLIYQIMKKKEITA